MWDYTDKVKEYFLHPKNVGEIENPDAQAEVGSLICGDALKLTLRLDEEKKKIVDAKFKTFGCGSAIASSSVLTELIKGKTLEEALKITNKDIADFLGGLPEEKMHCSVMAEEALEKAIHQLTNKDSSNDKEDESPIICQCFSVSKNKIIKAIQENHLHTVEEITHFTKAGGACGKCLSEIQNVIDEYYHYQKKNKVVQEEKLTNYQKISLIQKIINEEIAEQVKNDGGDIEILDIDLPKISIALKGACASCAVSSFTVSNIERLISDRIGESVQVISQLKK